MRKASLRHLVPSMTSGQVRALFCAALFLSAACQPDEPENDQGTAGGALLGEVSQNLSGGTDDAQPGGHAGAGGLDTTLGGQPFGGAPEEPLAGLSLNSLTPNRAPLSGGVRVRVIGAGFLEDTEVLIGDLPCRQVEWINRNRLSCEVPPNAVPGTYRVTALRRVEGETQEARLEDAFTYFEPLVGTGLEPNRVPSRGGTTVFLRAQGLTDATEVRVDGVEAANIVLESPGALTFKTPPHASGPVTVTASNFNGAIEFENGLTYYDVLELREISPNFGPLEGGTPVTITGSGFATDSAVRFGSGPATEVSANRAQAQISALTPPSSTAGRVDVTVSNTNGEAVLDDGFIYFDDGDSTFQLFGVTPGRGPIQGGTDVFVVGSGFTAEASVFFGDSEAQCTLQSSHILACTTPPGEAGLTSLGLEQGLFTANQVDAFRYIRQIELISVIPDGGSVAGGTRVTILGSGFDAETVVRFGEEVVSDVLYVDQGTLVATTPPNTPGPVDVSVEREFARDRQIDGFTYFDPVLEFGGVWGDLVDGAINLTVIHGSTGERIDEASLVVVAANGIVYEVVTDQNGQATVSAEGLSGPVNVTAAKEGFEASTIEEIENSNVTIVLLPNDGDGSPPPGTTGAFLSGLVTGLNQLPKPIDETYLNVIFVETSHPSPLSRPDMPEPGIGGILFEDGPFEIMAVPGEMAIIATAVEVSRTDFEDYQAGLLPYYQMRKSQIPIAMGMRRFISASPGDIIENLDVALDYPLETSVPVDLDNPPLSQNGGPQIYAASPVLLNLGSDGYWELDTSAESLEPYMTLHHMPNLEGWDRDIILEVFGIALSATQTGEPLSVSVAEVRNVNNGIFITPFVGTPYLIEPMLGGPLGADRRIAWGMDPGFEANIPIREPTAHLILISEPSLGGPRPIWRYLTPPGVNEFVFPVLPETAGASGLGVGRLYLEIRPFIVGDENFAYDEFTLMEISQLRWLSWAQTDFEFTVSQ